MVVSNRITGICSTAPVLLSIPLRCRASCYLGKSYKAFETSGGCSSRKKFLHFMQILLILRVSLFYIRMRSLLANSLDIVFVVFY